MFVLTHPHAISRRAGFHPAWSRAVERLLDERTTEARSDAAQVPAMDVSESETAYSLSFDLPGIVKEQVKVSIDGRKVSVEAAPAEAAAETEGARVVYRERSAPRFARSVTLPVELDASTSKARFANGVLTLTLVKKPLTGPTTLAVE
jgi:HSP20 family protein